MNGMKVFMDYSRGGYRANLHFPLSGDSVEFSKQWSYYQLVMQAALGTGYHYYMYSLMGKPYVTYFGSTASFPHRIRLETDKNEQGAYIRIQITSLVYRPAKAGLDAEDFE